MCDTDISTAGGSSGYYNCMGAELTYYEMRKLKLIVMRQQKFSSLIFTTLFSKKA